MSYRLVLAYKILYFRFRGTEKPVFLHKNYVKIEENIIHTSHFRVVQLFQLKRYLNKLDKPKYLYKKTVFEVRDISNIFEGYVFFDGYKFDYMRDAINSDGILFKDFINSFGIPVRHRRTRRRLEKYILSILSRHYLKCTS